MAQFEAYPGGSLVKWPLDSIQRTGLPGSNMRYSGHLPRSMFTLPFRFDGANEVWHEFMLFATANGQGLAVGDSIVGIYAPGTHTNNGAVLHLKKDLPSGIGITVTIESVAQDQDPAATDSFKTLTLDVPAGSKAGIVFIPYTTDKTSFAPYGARVVVRFNGADGMQVGQLLDTSGVCFEVLYTITDFHAVDGCTESQPICDYSLPGAMDMEEYPVNVSRFRVPAEAVSKAPSDTGGSTTAASSTATPSTKIATDADTGTSDSSTTAASSTASTKK